MSIQNDQELRVAFSSFYIIGIHEYDTILVTPGHKGWALIGVDIGKYFCLFIEVYKRYQSHLSQTK